MALGCLTACLPVGWDRLGLVLRGQQRAGMWARSSAVVQCSSSTASLGATLHLPTPLLLGTATQHFSQPPAHPHSTLS
jgi:hypothetical protein